MIKIGDEPIISHIMSIYSKYGFTEFIIALGYKSEVIKDYFLFPHIGRMDDIWAAFYVTAKKYKVVYNEPTVYQQRNVPNPFLFEYSEIDLVW